MKDNDKSKDEVALLKREVEYLKERIKSISESERSRDIETQKLKIHNIEERRIGISWLFRESKVSGAISILLPLLLAAFALGFVHSIVADILQEQAEILQALVAMGFNFAPILNMVPLIVFILVYVFGFKIMVLIAGTIVKHKILRREKNKLNILKSQLRR
jgi:hypothetical protein